MSAWSTSVVGHRYRGADGTYTCTAYAPRSGFWMRPDAEHDKPRNVSERAIGRTFHEVREPDDEVDVRRAALARRGVCGVCGDAGQTKGCATCAAYKEQKP